MSGATKSMLLQRRLNEIGDSLAKTGNALALLGLGSVGVELDRLDEYSDLDFFVIVKPGCKQMFIENLGWLSSIHAIAYAFRNTADGHKLLFEDGIFCEFAVFESAELPVIPFAAGRIIWKAPETDEMLLLPADSPARQPKPVEWLVGEALTNLYVGLARYRRGEKLSAARFVQGHAVDRIVDLADSLAAEQTAHRDIFASERRFEQRFPDIALLLPRFIQGYERTPESARAILEFLECHFEINRSMRGLILTLIETQPPLETVHRQGTP